MWRKKWQHCRYNVALLSSLHMDIGWRCVRSRAQTVTADTRQVSNTVVVQHNSETILPSARLTDMTVGECCLVADGAERLCEVSSNLSWTVARVKSGPMKNWLTFASDMQQCLKFSSRYCRRLHLLYGKFIYLLARSLFNDAFQWLGLCSVEWKGDKRVTVWKGLERSGRHLI
jgi:hypothetical protein